MRNWRVSWPTAPPQPRWSASRIRAWPGSSAASNASAASAENPTCSPCNQVYLGSPDAYKASLKRIEAATPDDVRSAAKALALRWRLRPRSSSLPANTKPSTAAADRSKLPDLGAFPELHLPKLQHSTLSNGMKVVLAERHETPLVNLWLVLDAGYAADQSALPGTAQAAAALLTGGTKTRTALQISDEQANARRPVGRVARISM